MKKLFCDKCNKEITGEKDFFSFSLGYAEWLEEKDDEELEMGKDLCRECAVILKKTVSGYFEPERS